METPKGTPEKIYLDLGFDPLETISNDFDSILSVTWSKDNASGNGVEYVRADIAEEMAKAFLIMHDTARIGDCVYAIKGNVHVMTNDELYDYFKQQK